MTVKITFFLIFLNIGINVFAQLRELSPEKKSEYLEKALGFERSNQIEEALFWYYYISQRDSISDSRESVQKKIDSLIPVVRKVILNKLKGKWKLSKNLERDSTNMTFSEFIKFKRKKIIFYDKFKRIKTENLKIEPFIYRLSYDYPSLKIGKNESWIIRFRELKNEQRLIFEKRMDKDGQVLITIDDRGIIRDKEKRKKALESEIFTYYIKIE